MIHSTIASSAVNKVNAKVELYNGWEQQDYDISAVNRTELGEYVTGTAGIK